MFAGFRSRWMMPCSCAASSASAICRAIGSASSSGNRRRARCARRASSPSTSSITSACMPSALFEAVDARRCSDDSATRALRLRARTARADRGRPRTTAGRTLIATSRFSLRVASRDRPRPCRRRRSARRFRTGRDGCRQQGAWNSRSTRGAHCTSAVLTVTGMHGGDWPLPCGPGRSKRLPADQSAPEREEGLVDAFRGLLHALSIRLPPRSSTVR